MTRRGYREVIALSAGFIGPGRPASPVTQRLAAQRGMDLGPHRSRQVTPGDVMSADLVVVMEPGQKRLLLRRFACRPEQVAVLGDLDPLPIKRRAVQDPYGHPDSVFKQVYARIERCMHALVCGIEGGELRRTPQH
jgi:protein-tyrosine phosphatase